MNIKSIKGFQDFISMSWVLMVALYAFKFFSDGLAYAKWVYAVQLIVFLTMIVCLAIAKKRKGVRLDMFISRVRTHLIGSALICNMDVLATMYTITQLAAYPELAKGVLYELAAFMTATVILVTVATRLLPKPELQPAKKG